MRTSLFPFARSLKTLKALKHDTRGSMATLFAVASAGVFLSVGAAVDFGQSLKVRTTMAGAADAASLSAAKLVAGGEKDLDRLAEAARAAYDANFQIETDRGFLTETFEVEADFDTRTVTVRAGGTLDTLFMGLAGIETVDVGVASSSTMDKDEIEVALMLDLTGSMASKTSDGAVKIDVLETAAKSLVTTLIPTDTTAKDVRIALAPYTAAVNAGTLAPLVTGGKTKTACVLERVSGSNATDASPTASPFKSGGSCPARAVLPLTGERAKLLKQLDDLPADGTTAGHLGTAWTFGLLSPNWAGVLKGAEPRAYGAKGNKKIAILMTDGEYNTWNGSMSAGNVAKSNTAAVDSCAAMRKAGITVYAVGFALGGNADAIATLKSCASTEGGQLLFYNAEDGDDLIAAYADIAARIQQLRLAS